MLYAQFDFSFDGKQVQIHSFASQGLIVSDKNNFLTMDTSRGSLALTDGGVSASTQLTDSWRVGAQMYVRNVGQLGDWQPQLDWAYADYRFARWFGVRAGKVKTALGLYNDVQDIDSMQTFALLPQGLYPMDLRSNFIAHTGADVYGIIPAFRKSQVRYTVYAGARANDPNGGYYYMLETNNPPLAQVNSFGGNTTGADLRLETPLHGFTVGSSYLIQSIHVALDFLHKFPGRITDGSGSPEQIVSGYMDYAAGRWHLSGEYRRDKAIRDVTLMGKPYMMSNGAYMGAFGTVAFRVDKRLEVGTYHSWFYVDAPKDPGPAANHIFDQAVTARFDLAKFWYAKIEGHFMDGYGDLYSAHGFYVATNPDGLRPKTNMLVVRTGVSF
jgi:hypothetical protein